MELKNGRNFIELCVALFYLFRLYESVILETKDELSISGTAQMDFGCCNKKSRGCNCLQPIIKMSTILAYNLCASKQCV